jgi:hypothetical protein
MRIRSARSVVSCHTHGPTTSTNAPTTAPGTMNGPDEPLVPRKITAPASRSVTPSTGRDPPGRSEPPCTRTIVNPATSKVAPITALQDSPSAKSSAAAAAATSAAAAQVRQPSP